MLASQMAGSLERWQTGTLYYLDHVILFCRDTGSDKVIHNSFPDQD